MSQKDAYYTFCDGCNQVPMCGVRFHVEDNIVTEIGPWPNHPRSSLCVKAYTLPQVRHHPLRLLYPMKRTNQKGSSDPGWIRISWDEAYTTVIAKLKEIRDKYGPEAVVFYVGDPKEPRAAVQRLCYTFGSPNYATESSICKRAAELAELLTFGVPLSVSLPSPQTRLCVIWGSNPAWSRQYVMLHLLEAKKLGVKFIIVDPRRTPTVEKLADLHLQVRPASDGALALAIINTMIERGIYDKEFVEKWVYGFEELKNYASNFTPEKAEKLTWVPADKITEAAQMIGDNKPVTFLLSAQSTTHNKNAVQNHRAILSLIALTGCLDVPGGVRLQTRELISDWSHGDPEFCRRNDLFPMLEAKRLDRQMFPVWARYMFEVQINLLPEYVKTGKVKAMLMWGANLMMWPQTHEYQEAVKNLEFAVAIDHFYRPWTHDYVDIVLPAAMCLERQAPFAFFGKRIYGRKVLKPAGECKEDWQIALEIGVKLGYAEEFWNGSVSEALNSILKRFGITVEELERNIEKGIEIHTPEIEAFRRYEAGLLRTGGELGFPTPTGKVEIYSTILEEYGYDPLPVFKEPMEPTEEYPLILITGSRVPFYTHSRGREIQSIRKLMPNPVVNMNPEDAAQRNICEGDDVLVFSPWGKIKVKAHLTTIMPKGVIDVLHGWCEANVNELVPREFDPISGFPPFKECICEVKKLN
ncbi:MAG: molybdopterin-dependent oxidoreductase [Candidatus Bathyarchaeia archaeon]|nr:molybdopterin-dependent oxidoreductase [Candidatus Bathyarchaeota archaeon]